MFWVQSTNAIKKIRTEKNIRQFYFIFWLVECRVNRRNHIVRHQPIISLIRRLCV